MTFWKKKSIHLGDQNITELTILEWKRFFSIKLFNFHKTDGKQDRFHTHAFNALSIRLSGDYIEEIVEGDTIEKYNRSRKRFLFIPRDSFHRITKSDGCCTLLITGPWGSEFKELRPHPNWKNAAKGRISVWREHICGPQRRDLRKGDIYFLKEDI